MDKPPIDSVIDFLKAERQYNVDHRILPSENKVIDAIIKHRVNFAVVCDELFNPLDKDQQEAIPPHKQHLRQWELAISRIVSLAAFWSPDQMKKTRDAIREVKYLNQEIAKTANKLAKLLERREEISNTYAIATPDDSHPVEVIIKGAEILSECGYWGFETGYNFNEFVREHLENLAGAFDTKYWPSTADVVKAIARLQDHIPVVIDHTKTTQAAIASRQSSPRDFIRGLLANFKETHIVVRLSPKALAEIVNCALDLPNDQLITEETVKKFLFDQNTTTRDKNSFES